MKPTIQSMILTSLALFILPFAIPRYDKPIETAEAFYVAPDSCGLEAVVCPGEVAPKPVITSSRKIINAIAKIETNSGKTGVGRSRNNPTGLKCGVPYCRFQTLEDGYLASLSAWDKNYAGRPLDDALAKWKTGNSKDRSAATVAYIGSVKKQL